MKPWANCLLPFPACHHFPLPNFTHSKEFFPFPLFFPMRAPSSFAESCSALLRMTPLSALCCAKCLASALAGRGASGQPSPEVEVWPLCSLTGEDRGL